MTVAKKAAGAAKVDALAMLKNLAKPGAAKSTKKADRNSFELTEDLGEVLRNWVPAKILFDRFDAHAKNLGTELKEGVFKLWIEQLWGNKAQPQNPKLSVDNDNGKVDCEGMFIVMEKYQVTVPDVGDKSIEEAFVDVLVDMAGDETFRAKAEELVANELSFLPQVTLPLTSLLAGRKVGKTFQEATEDQKSAVSKLLMMLDGEETSLDFTDGEKAALAEAREIKFQTQVKPGFLNRVHTYCKNIEQLKAVFRMVTPTLALKGAKFAVSDSPETQHTRLLEQTAQIFSDGNLNDDSE